MANTLKFGNGEWYGKKDTILAYNDLNSNYKPLPFNFSRDSKATVINKDGLIQEVGSGQPRIDYKDDSKGALLLEPQRTNSLVQSNQFDTTWTTSNQATVTSGYLGLDGTNSAWLLTRTESSYANIRQNITFSGTHTFSVYLKKGTLTSVALRSTGGLDARVEINLIDGTTSNKLNTTSVKTELVGNDWWRCSLTFEATVNTAVRIYPDSVTGTTAGNIYMQYAQLESGSYATSYIPTSGSAVTRVADNITQTTPNLSNSQEITVFIDLGARPLTGINTTSNNFRLDFGTGNTRIIYNQNSSSNHRIELNNNGSANFYTLSNLLTTTRAKIGVSLTPTTLVIYANGVEYYSVSIASADWSNLLEIETLITDAIGNIKINDFKFYNTALTDQELIALTQV